MTCNHDCESREGGCRCAGGSSLAVEAAETLRELGRENARLRAVERAARKVSERINAALNEWAKGDSFDVVDIIEDDRALRAALSTVAPAPSAGDQGEHELTPEWTANVLSRPNALLDYVRRAAPASTEGRCSCGLPGCNRDAMHRGTGKAGGR